MIELRSLWTVMGKTGMVECRLHNSDNGNHITSVENWIGDVAAAFIISKGSHARHHVRESTEIGLKSDTFTKPVSFNLMSRFYTNVVAFLLFC